MSKWRIIFFSGLVLLGSGLMCSASYAESADRDKPIHLEADQVSIDDARQTSIFVGNVVLTQGTLVIRGDQIVVVQTKDGFKHGTATGRPASFRQKRDGVDEYVEGFGDRIEYDSRSEVMDIYGHARVRRGDDEVRGEHITYNSRKEIFQASSAPVTPSAEAERRVRVVIPPEGRSAASAAVPAEPLLIKPDTTLSQPEGGQ